MSLSFGRVKAVQVRDPRTIVSDSAKYAVLKAGSQTTFKQYSTTSISSSSLQFTCTPPSGGIFVDRNVRLYVPVRLTFTGIPALGDTLLRPGYDAPRAFGLQSAIDTLVATINNQNVNINPAEVLQPLMWFNTGAELKNSDYSTTPCYQDQSQSYDDLVGTVRNPLANYANGLDNTPQPRGAFPFVVIANPVGDGAATVTAIVDVCFNESLYLSPFWWGRGVSNEAFFNVTTMDFNINFLSQAANRMWSHSSASGVPFLSSSVSFGPSGGAQSFGTTTGNSPAMFFTYITPQETQVLSPAMAISYPYFNIQQYPTTVPSVAAGASATITSSNIQLSSIPRRMYIFVRKQNNDLYASAESTDTYFAISGISVQFMNKSGLLGSANMQQLYEMSVKNHCTMSWTQWSGKSAGAAGVFGSVGTVGSIICIEFGSDIGLDSLDAPGKLAQAMLQVQVNATNVSGAAIVPSLYIVTVSEGVFTIKGLNQSSSNIGVLTSQEILDCQYSHVDYRDVQDVNGGDFFSGVKEGLSRLLTRENLGKAASLAHSGLRATHALSSLASMTPAAPAAPFLRALGYGGGEGSGSGEGSGEGSRRRSRVRFGESSRRGSGVLVAEGGEELSRADLARRILL